MNYCLNCICSLVCIQRLLYLIQTFNPYFAMARDAPTALWNVGRKKTGKITITTERFSPTMYKVVNNQVWRKSEGLLTKLTSVCFFSEVCTFMLFQHWLLIETFLKNIAFKEHGCMVNSFVRSQITFGFEGPLANLAMVLRFQSMYLNV